MMWTISNSHNQNIDFNNKEIITLGKNSECQLNIPNFIGKSIHSQIILDDGFIFHILNNKVHTYFLDHNIKIMDHEFFINFKNEYIFEEEMVRYPTINDFFESQEFIKLLDSVRKSFFEFHKFDMEINAISPKDFIQYASGILTDILFNSENIFNEELRKNFKQILLCLWAQVFKYGILTAPILDPEISEIMVNGYESIYFEKKGKISTSSLKFQSEVALLSLIERICSSIGRRIDENMPYCDARLQEGHRVHVIIPPLSLIGPCLTIRKFPNFSYDIETLIQNGAMEKECADILKNAIIEKNNIVISGGTGAGKTTLLNSLSSFIPENERILTIEDSAELRLKQPHVLRLECRAENIENQGKVMMRDLVKNALRMRPDRIIIGECRGAEALDMLQAMNTGHEGSLTTVHANSPKDALLRIETMVMFSEIDLPSHVIRQQIASTIHLIVQQSRLSSGQRKITAIEKIIGFDEKTGIICSESLYSCKK